MEGGDIGKKIHLGYNHDFQFSRTLPLRLQTPESALRISYCKHIFNALTTSTRIYWAHSEIDNIQDAHFVHFVLTFYMIFPIMG